MIYKTKTAQFRVFQATRSYIKCAEAWSDTWTPLIWKYVAISDLLFKKKSNFEDEGGKFHFTMAQISDC